MPMGHVVIGCSPCRLHVVLSYYLCFTCNHRRTALHRHHGFSYVPAGWVVAALKDDMDDPRQRRVRVRHHRLTGRHSYSFVVVDPRAKHAFAEISKFLRHHPVYAANGQPGSVVDRAATRSCRCRTVET